MLNRQVTSLVVIEVQS